MRQNQNPVPFCPNCTYNPNTDSGKLLPARHNGKLHIMLEKVTATGVYSCPKCNMTALPPNFKRKQPPEAIAKQNRQRSQERVQQLKEMYGKP